MKPPELNVVSGMQLDCIRAAGKTLGDCHRASTATAVMLVPTARHAQCVHDCPGQVLVAEFRWCEDVSHLLVTIDPVITNKARAKHLDCANVLVIIETAPAITVLVSQSFVEM